EDADHHHELHEAETALGGSGLPGSAAVEKGGRAGIPRRLHGFTVAGFVRSCQYIVCRGPFYFRAWLEGAGDRKAPPFVDCRQPVWLFISVRMVIMGMNRAMTMVPTSRARKTIMIGSIIEVMA